MNTQTHVTTQLSPFPLYQDLELRCNTHLMETTTGAPTIILDDHWDFSRLAIIDGFVQKALGTDEAGYISTTGINGRVVWFRQPWVEPYYRSVTSAISPLMHERFDVRNVYVDLFLHACTELQILDWTSHVLMHGGTKSEANAVAFNNLIETIRRLSKHRPYPSKTWHAQNDWQMNRDSCLAFVASLFSEWSRYAVVRVDLAYRKEHAYEVFTADARADTRVAAAVIAAHQGANNFYNEPGPMRELAKLGSSIPGPALAQCISAALCVKLGNQYGTSWSAQESANEVLNSLSSDRLIYYFNERLENDDLILGKLMQTGKPLQNWISWVSKLDVDPSGLKSKLIKQLVIETKAKNALKVAQIAGKLVQLRGEG